MTGAFEQIDVAVADGLRFHVARTGSGPNVVLLHGFTGSTETWTELQTALADRFTTIAVDITGHGRSDAPADSVRYSLTRFAHDLRDILDALGVERAILLGYSMGGRAALRFAFEHPERVAGLILESTSPGIADPAERTARIAADESLADTIEASGVAAFVNEWERIPLWASLSALPEAAHNRLRDQRLKNSPSGLANSLRGAGSGADAFLSERLERVRTPVRIIVGEHDLKYVPLGKLMESCIPQSRLAIVRGSGHMAHLEQPERFREIVTALLTEMAADNESAGPRGDPA